MKTYFNVLTETTALKQWLYVRMSLRLECYLSVLLHEPAMNIPLSFTPDTMDQEFCMWMIFFFSLACESEVHIT